MAPAIRGASKATERAVARSDAFEIPNVDPGTETLGAALSGDLPTGRTATVAREAVQAMDGDRPAADAVPA